MFEGSFKKHARLAIPAYIILAAIVIIASIISSDFASIDNISNVISQSAPVAVAAIGQTLVLMLGGIDLSIGSVVSLATIIMAQLSPNSNSGLAAGIFVCVTAGALVGYLNGTGIIRFKIPPMIMTLATMAVVKGVALYIQPSPGGKVHYGFMSFITKQFGLFNVLGVFVLLFYLCFLYMLACTRFGRNIYATGGDITSSRKSGVPVERTTVATYMLSGIFAAIGGMLLSANMFSGDPIVGEPYSMDTVTAAIVGGTSLAGGIGGVIGTLGGIYLVSMTGNILNMFGVFPYYQYILKGLILVLAIFIKRKEKKI